MIEEEKTFLGLTKWGWFAAVGIVALAYGLSTISPVIGIAIGAAGALWGWKVIWPRIKGL